MRRKHFLIVLVAVVASFAAGNAVGYLTYSPKGSPTLIPDPDSIILHHWGEDIVFAESDRGYHETLTLIRDIARHHAKHPEYPCGTVEPEDVKWMREGLSAELVYGWPWPSVIILWENNMVQRLFFTAYSPVFSGALQSCIVALRGSTGGAYGDRVVGYWRIENEYLKTFEERLDGIASTAIE